jgi:hypothetical protein
MPAGGQAGFFAGWHKMNLDFTKLDGLLPAVIQDQTSGRVLMVGFMNEEAFRRTVETGFATFYSRSPEEAVDEGRKLRPPTRGQGDLDRLRPGSRGGAGPWRVPQRLPELLRRLVARRGHSPAPQSSTGARVLP